MERIGRCAEFKDGRLVGVEYRPDAERFMLVLEIPLDQATVEGSTEETAIEEHRKAKVNLVEGKVRTTLSISQEAFFALMTIGCEVANQIAATTPPHETE